MMTTKMIMMMMKRKGKTFIPVRVTNLNFLRTISIHVRNHEKVSNENIQSDDHQRNNALISDIF